MLSYTLTVLIGLLTLAIALVGLPVELELRRKRNCEILHTAFTIYDRRDSLGREVQAELYCTDNLIGRRKRKCNICLDKLHDPSISRIHARLWLENGHFCIAPVPRGLLPNRLNYPQVFVRDVLVPPQGMVVYHGDIIQLGNSRFYLKDTKERAS